MMRKKRVPKMYKNLGPLKPYDYKIQLRPNYLLSSQTTAGAFAWATASGAAGQAPFNGVSPTITGSPTGFTGLYNLGLGTSFRLEDITSVADWQNMYDAYRINKIVCEVEFIQNVAAGASGQGSVLPTLYMVYDQDSAGNPPNLLTIQGQQGVKRFCVGDKGKVRFGMSIRPRSQQLLAAPSTSYGVNRPGMWLNCASSAINHFGLKFYITDLLAAGTNVAETAVKFQFTYYMSFRGPLNNS